MPLEQGEDTVGAAVGVHRVVGGGPAVVVDVAQSHAAQRLDALEDVGPGEGEATLAVRHPDAGARAVHAAQQHRRAAFDADRGEARLVATRHVVVQPHGRIGGDSGAGAAGAATFLRVFIVKKLALECPLHGQLSLYRDLLTYKS